MLTEIPKKKSAGTTTSIMCVPMIDLCPRHFQSFGETFQKYHREDGQVLPLVF